METLLEQTRSDILAFSVFAAMAIPVMVVVMFYIGLAYL